MHYSSIRHSKHGNDKVNPPSLNRHSSIPESLTLMPLDDTIMEYGSGPGYFYLPGTKEKAESLSEAVTEYDQSDLAG